MKCLDTYALVEIHGGNEKFVKLLLEECVITDLTLTEFYGEMYKRLGKQTADFWHRKLAFMCRPTPREILIEAITYRFDNKKENLSFFDCVGYLFAKRNNIPFVTGDKAFKGKPGAEWIK